uniref:Uncharacterized protein LOC111117558 n=1 Tax=Crassostrea virginica TaxID=6565 RepID=A0A8B8C9V5_CRAVI|nr:uncharacterized protein LOC111117558 [Crassostrea virginica]
MAKINSAGRVYDKGTPLGIDLRRSIINYMEEQGAKFGSLQLPRGLPQRVSEIFKVSHPLVTKIWKQYCIEGIVKLPEYKSGRKRKLDQEDVQHIHFLKETKPSMPLKSVKEEVLKYSNAVIKVSESTISRHLKNDLNMTYKRIARYSKNRFTPQNMNYTQNFLNYVGQKDPFSLKFMDEMGVKLSDGQNVYGHSLKGTPCIEMTRHNPHRNVTASVIVGISGVKYVKIFDGASNGTEYTQFIAEATQSYTDEGEPVFNPGDCLIADNAPIHHNMAERELNNYLPTVGVEYVFLPTYSPDLNPAEQVFRKVKKILKCDRYITLLNLDLKVAVYEAFKEISTADTLSFFRSTEYIKNP